MIQPCSYVGAHAPVFIAEQRNGRDDFPDKPMQITPIVKDMQGEFQLRLGRMQIIPRRRQAFREGCNGGGMHRNIRRGRLFC
ncbi:MAG: hypothetical protein A3H25_18220 [Sphingomonadales bacterium RIFCSPLOWO2_12_FULL_63_15]|nr:MAG: hypothetical protein A3H25_18220 [Sphingomonadales bacterium RIFCSPLOWO2_12_FULL_63_15]